MSEAERPRAEPVTRRELLAGAAALGAAATAAATLRGSAARAQPAPSAAPPAYRGEHAVRPLPFDPGKLAGLSAKLLVSHHQNNYGGAVKRLNAIQQQLGGLSDDVAPYQVGSLKREELIARNSVLLHELYFANLGGSGAPSGPIAEQLGAAYGSLARWEHDFRQTALSLAGGSGWVVVAYDPETQRAHNWWAWDHAHQLAAGVPLLVLDMYEHAYHIDYGAAAKGYIDAFLANVQWSEVNRRAAGAGSLRQPA